MRIARWDLLLVGLILSPIAVGRLFLSSQAGRLTLEVVPADQGSIMAPSPGDIVDAYGTWVIDAHLFDTFGWNEIHPAVFLRNLTSGKDGGTQECNVLEDVHDPERLRILDKAEPCK